MTVSAIVGIHLIVRRLAAWQPVEVSDGGHHADRTYLISRQRGGIPLVSTLPWVVDLPVVVAAGYTTRENRTVGSITMTMGCAATVVDALFVTCFLRRACMVLSVLISFSWTNLYVMPSLGVYSLEWFWSWSIFHLHPVLLISFVNINSTARITHYGAMYYFLP